MPIRGQFTVPVHRRQISGFRTSIREFLMLFRFIEPNIRGLAVEVLHKLQVARVDAGTAW